MAVLPAEIPTGLVTGQFYFVSADLADANTDPEMETVTGVVRFTSSAPLLRMPTKKATLVPLSFDAKFNANGELVSVADPTVGLKLPRTDSPLINPVDYTWWVEFLLSRASNGQTIKIPGFAIRVPAGGTDLTVDMPVQVSNGVQVIQGEPGAGVPKGGTALQLIRNNAAGTTTEWITPSKALVGLDKVDNTADSDKPVSAPQRTAIDEAKGGMPSVATVAALPAAGSNAGRAYYVTSTKQEYLSNGATWGAVARVSISETSGRVVRIWDYLNQREQIIYGDTGLRNISADITALVSGIAYLNRSGNQVTLSFVDASFGSLTGQQEFAALPAGFRPAGWQHFATSPRGGSLTAGIIIKGDGVIRAYNLVAGQLVFGTFNFTTSEPWPTALPGIAVGVVPV